MSRHRQTCDQMYSQQLLKMFYNCSFGTFFLGTCVLNHFRFIKKARGTDYFQRKFRVVACRRDCWHSKCVAWVGVAQWRWQLCVGACSASWRENSPFREYNIRRSRALQNYRTEHVQLNWKSNTKFWLPLSFHVDMKSSAISLYRKLRLKYCRSACCPGQRFIAVFMLVEVAFNCFLTPYQLAPCTDKYLSRLMS